MKSIFNLKKVFTLLIIGLFFFSSFTPLSMSLGNILTNENSNQTLISNEDDDTNYYAVIAACSVYNDSNNNIPKKPFKPISERNLKSLYDSLMGADNWKKENIILLINEDATAENIRNSIHEFSLIADSDDVFLFSWCGHGSNIPDIDGDEKTESKPDDIYDEIICPYDTEIENNEFINVISDDELGLLFSEFSVKGMCLIFDCCLSGGLVNQDIFDDNDNGFIDESESDGFIDDFSNDIKFCSSYHAVDVDDEGRVIILSTFDGCLGRATYMYGFPINSGMSFAFNVSSNRISSDANNDGIITAEEGFNYAKPLILGELSTYWVGMWFYAFLNYYRTDTNSGFKKVIKSMINASLTLLVSYAQLQIMTKILTGRYMFTWPSMIDLYVSSETNDQLPIIYYKF